MTEFKFLYFFEGPDHRLVEIKILNDDLPRDKKYHWMLYNKQEQSFIKLTFSKMNETTRTFKEGILAFNDGSAQLKLGPEVIKMKNHSEHSVNPEFKLICHEYLSKIN